MLYIENLSTNPYHNLACEEYILKQTAYDKVVMLWQNDNAIIVGKHQNTSAEINSAYVEEHGIRVARRITGGGTLSPQRSTSSLSPRLPVKKQSSTRTWEYRVWTPWPIRRNWQPRMYDEASPG